VLAGTMIVMPDASTRTMPVCLASPLPECITSMTRPPRLGPIERGQSGHRLIKDGIEWMHKQVVAGAPAGCGFRGRRHK
jgi:hypothetical protein